MMGISTTKLTAIITVYQAMVEIGLRTVRQTLQTPVWRGAT